MISRRKVFLLVLFSILSFSSFSQQDTLLPKAKFNWDYIHSGFLDARDQILAPLHWDGVQWMTIATIVPIESVLIFADGDKNVQEFAQQNRNNITNFLEKDIGDPLGSGLYPAIIIGSSYIAGCIFHKEKPKRFAMLAVKSIVISGATVAILKYISGRHRPYQDNPSNPLDWVGPVLNPTDFSFPSGHTVIAFSLASMLAMEYPRPVIIPILAYGLATITAYGRINGNYHWASDVILSAAIGYFTSKLVYTHNNWGKLQRHKKSPPKE
jgi:membrane-associated phospholipid phosphatase